MKKIPRPVNLPKPTSDLSTKGRCKTCAYYKPCTPEEDEMARWYWEEKPVPHPCHERQGGMVCKGALDTFNRLGLKVDIGQLGK
jgi:hypothetical protein